MKKPCKHRTLKVRVTAADYETWTCRCGQIELFRLPLERTQPLTIQTTPVKSLQTT